MANIMTFATDNSKLTEMLDGAESSFDLSDFGLSPSSISGEIDKYDRKVKVFLDRLMVNQSHFTKQTVEIIHNFLADFRLPERGEQLRLRTQQQINMISIILKITDIHEVIDELTIATYTLNREAFYVLMDLLDAGRIKRLNLMIASSYHYRANDYLEDIKRRVLSANKSGKDCHLTLAWMHFKISLARCGEDLYQIEGSMNYSTNNMAEQLLIENNEMIYQQDYEFISGLMHGQTNKALEVIC